MKSDFLTISATKNLHHENAKTQSSPVAAGLLRELERIWWFFASSCLRGLK